MSGLISTIERRPQLAFAVFLALHFLVWTALPALLYPNLPLDLIEALTYGREWQLGYDKLPPLPWWLIEIAHRLVGRDAAYYALAQLAVVGAFALVWLTARPLVGPLGALVAVLIIDGLHYFQFHRGQVQSRRDPAAVLGARRLSPSTPRSRRGRLAHWAAARPRASGSRCGRNISWWCWRRRWRCSSLLDRDARKSLGDARPLASRSRSRLWSWRRIWSGSCSNDFLPFAYAEPAPRRRAVCSTTSCIPLRLRHQPGWSSCCRRC